MTKKTLALMMSLLLATSAFSGIVFAEGPNGPHEQKRQAPNHQNGGERRNAPDGNHDSGKGNHAAKQTSREHRDASNFRERDHFAWRGNNFRKGHPAPQRFRGDDYRVNDWRARGLGEPPAGQHWAHIDGNYVLIAATTGIITAILMNGALD
ncbi:RcnB family protein [Brenneria rubrifaciens]|uniref:RcnB family protein n=1 Tax=Brenneria rubrifaciens TaxID=55213 RepID=A0A4P8QWZ8_9GAMM|nr:RcnB family protein [Brenneria rubrifaciens]QCR08735.1 hypothetical protein EH207_09425 [Brenneria rubrifaciens]